MTYVRKKGSLTLSKSTDQHQFFPLSPPQDISMPSSSKSYPDQIQPVLPKSSSTGNTGGGRDVGSN